MKLKTKITKKQIFIGSFVAGVLVTIATTVYVVPQVVSAYQAVTDTINPPVNYERPEQPVEDLGEPEKLEQYYEEELKALAEKYEKAHQTEARMNALNRLAIAIADAIKLAETNGAANCHYLPGASREKGCYQYLESTWRLYANEVLGYVPPRTYINERYVAAVKIERWLRSGYSAREIALIWNGGEPVEKSGVNRYGVVYDTARYARNVLTYLNR